MLWKKEGTKYLKESQENWQKKYLEVGLVSCDFFILYPEKNWRDEKRLEEIRISSKRGELSCSTVSILVTYLNCCGCPIPGRVQARLEGPWAAWSHARCPCLGQGFGAKWSLMSLPTQSILWFCEFKHP